jgi:hypothetical protein
MPQRVEPLASRGVGEEQKLDKRAHDEDRETQFNGCWIIRPYGSQNRRDIGGVPTDKVIPSCEPGVRYPKAVSHGCAYSIVYRTAYGLSNTH